MTVKIWMHAAYPRDTIHVHAEAMAKYDEMKASICGTLNTTCTTMCDARILSEDWNRLIIAFPLQEVELQLNEPCISGRVINAGLNLQKLLLAGEFNPPEPTVYCHIYQIPCNENSHGRVFAGLEERVRCGIPYPNISEYDHIYDYAVEEDMGYGWKLERVYEKFNISRPEGYEGRSLTCSDVVLVNASGTCEAYFCDTTGFVKLDHRFFMKRESKED